MAGGYQKNISAHRRDRAYAPEQGACRLLGMHLCASPLLGTATMCNHQDADYQEAVQAALSHKTKLLPEVKRMRQQKSILVVSRNASGQFVHSGHLLANVSLFDSVINTFGWQMGFCCFNKRKKLSCWLIVF